MNAYRRAAIVVSSLDRNAADDLLERLPADQARAIRDELVLLDDPNQDEQLHAIEDYLQPTSIVDEPAFGDSTSECDDMVASQTDAADSFVTHAATPVLTELLAQSDESIADALKYERASVVSALLHSLPQKRAAGILRQLHPQLQWRVMSNLNQGQRSSLHLIEIIADRICEKQATRIDPKANESQEDALKAIFSELSLDEQREMLRSLAVENPMLAQRLVPKLPSTASNAATRDCYC